ncbi:MAG: hypothetical protein JWM56_83 [Candidatus Peribacteria bacterium]|nr:hypothetical protein [Candidatus Peribacteria bacterium]
MYFLSPFMISQVVTLFIAGLLTILLPCILPLVPIVLGVSVTDKNPWRPLTIIGGMLVSFVGFTFIIQVLLSQFVTLAVYIQTATFYILLLFGLGFAFHNKWVQYAGAFAGAFFFWDKGPLAVAVAALLGIIAMELGGKAATRIQQLGTDVQTKTRSTFGGSSLLTAFIIGLTMGLVWVPCAGPALGFALSVVRDKPGIQALLYLSAYGVGSAIPLLLIGYGGQKAVHSARALTKYSGTIKQISGFILIIAAILFQQNIFQDLQTRLAGTYLGSFAEGIESRLFPNQAPPQQATVATDKPLPVLGAMPELTGLGPWHNSSALTNADLKGKVVLVDFWTYSCINCIRTLPYIQGYWEKFSQGKSVKDSPFILLGVHTPEFVFEKNEQNVAGAIKKHGLTYPVAQDNDFGTWNAFQNHYWPAKYLIDAKGNIRYTHFGEGGYEETDKAIASLLKETGVNAKAGISVKTNAGSNAGGDISPETYVGARNWDQLSNKKSGITTKAVKYDGPCTPNLNEYCLIGIWQLKDNEHQVLINEDGEIHMKFKGGEINLVLGLEENILGSIANVSIDGKHVRTFDIKENDLQQLFKGDYGTHDLVLTFKGKGVQAYAFTFGG